MTKFRPSSGFSTNNNRGLLDTDEAVPGGRASLTSGGSGPAELRHGRRTGDRMRGTTTMRSRLWLGAAATLPLIGLAITSGGAAPAGAASAHHSAHAAGTPTTG